MSRALLIRMMVIVILLALMAIGGVVAYYYIFQPDKNVTLSKENSDKMAGILKEVNYVSPNANNGADQARAVYLVTYKGCDACNAYEDSEFPKLHNAGIDTRVIVYSPSAGMSTQDKATIVELWLSRNWTLYQNWRKNPAWTAIGVPPADDMARKYVLKATGDVYTQMTALIPSKNPSDVHAPLVMWVNTNGEVKVCLCSSEATYHVVRDDFGVSDINIKEGIDNIISNVSSAASSASSNISKAASENQSRSDFGPEN